MPAARRIARLTPIAAGFAAAALALPASATADMPLPEANGEIAFSADDDVYTVVPSDGSAPTPQPNAGQGVVGQWRSDGTQVTVTSDMESYITSFDFPQSTSLFHFMSDTGYSDGAALGPSPSHDEVAYTDDHGLVVKAPPHTRIMPGGTGRPAWSIQGKVYYRKGASGGTSGIWAYNPYTNTESQLVADGTARNPSVSGDGTVIAYEATVAGNTDIYVIDSGADDMTPHVLAGMTLEKEHTPAVSPDGKHVAFAVQGLEKRIVSVTRATGVAKTIATTGNVTGMAWRPVDAAQAAPISILGTPTIGGLLVAEAPQSSTGSMPRIDSTGFEVCTASPAVGAADASCTEVTTQPDYTVKAADAGKYVRAFNRAANGAGADTAYSAAVQIVAPDAVPPAAPLLSEKPAAFIDARYPQFAWTGAESGGTFECRLIDLNLPPEIAPDWETCVSPVKPDALDSGKYRFEVRQVDAASNKGAATTHTFEVDLVDPEKPLLTGTPDAVTTDAAAPFTFEKTGSEPTTFQCRIDGNFGESRAEWEPCVSPFVPAGLDVGYHTFEVRQVDRAGNSSSRATYDWRLDATVAPPTVTKRPDARTTDTTATFEFTGETVAQCSVDGGVWGTCTSPLVLKNRTVGEHSLRMRNFTAHGAGGEVTTIVWTVLGAEVPVVETPAPVAPAPAVEAPKPAATTPAPAPAAVEAPKPAAKPAAVKAPALVATIGGTKTGPSTSSDATIEVAKESVGVGCSITGTVLKSCKVDLYADVAGGTTARAAAVKQVLVGTGTYEKASGASKLDVKIELNKTGKAMLRRSPNGLKVSVKITGNPVNGPALKATGTAKLVTDRASATIGGFAVSSARLTPKAKAQLRTLAKFGKAASVRCVGHTDGSSENAGYLRSLGAKRAKAVCAYLAEHGVKAARKALVSKADTAPASTNATESGRARNRRVVVTLVR